MNLQDLLPKIDERLKFGLLVRKEQKFYAKLWSLLLPTTLKNDSKKSPFFRETLLSNFSIYRRYAGIPDFLTADDMEGMVSDNRLDPKMIFSYVQEVYRMCNEM